MDRLLTKLIAGCLGPLVFALVCQAVYTVVAQSRAMDRGLADKARSLTDLTVRVAGPSLAFDDFKSAADALAYLQSDPDFKSAQIFDRGGRLLAFRGAEAERARWSRPVASPATALMASDAATITALRPIVTGGKAIGAVQLVFSTERVCAQVRRRSLAAAFIALSGVAAAVLVVSLLARRIARQNRDLATLLDNTEQGFLTVNGRGELAQERSAAARAWLGPPVRGQVLWQAVGRVDARSAAWLKAGWENLMDGGLPPAVALDQMPKRIQCADCQLRLEVKPFGSGDPFQQGLVVLSDITSDLAAEHAEAMGRDLVRVLEKMAHDRIGFFEFLENAEHLIGEIDQELTAVAPPAAADVTDGCRRDVHTLKGNAAMFGLLSVSERCHDLERVLADDGDGEAVAARKLALVTTWREMRSKLSGILQHAEGEMLEVHPPDLELLESRLAQGAPVEELLELVDSWRFEPVHSRLERSAAQARELARRLGHEALVVRVEAARLRMQRDRLQPFWQVFGHVLRNAVDHGIEPASERRAMGKPGDGTLTLRAGDDGHRVFVEVEDDGRGIDWSRVAARAQSLGLPHATEPELVAALFCDGLSTREHASETSGRGVGLSAVQAACLGSKGRIEVQSKPGQGTRFRFSWPISRRREGVAPAARPVASRVA